MFWLGLSVILTMCVVPGICELLVLTLAGVLPRRQMEQTLEECPRLAIVVPAHDEEQGIVACLESLHISLGAAMSPVTLVVVADNCSDATAMKALESGARVLERHDPARRGKGYALDFAFRQLLPEGFDGFIVVDADSRVDGDFIRAFQISMAKGYDAVQCRYATLNSETSFRSRLQHVAWLAFNQLRLRGRERLGVSVGLLGNGFCLSRETLLTVPYDAASIAEDLEYHLRLVRAGKCVHWLDETTVYAAAPTQSRASAMQRSRWEGGRFRLIIDQVPVLCREVLRGRLALLEPLAELLLLPLAYHVLLLLILLVIPSLLAHTVAILGLLVLIGHIGAALILGGGGWREVVVLLWAPVYILWKLTLMPQLFRSAKKQATWQRTEREVNHEERP